MSTETPDTRTVAAERGAVPAAPTPRRPGLVLAVIAAAQLMLALDLTIVNVALPHIQAALGFSGPTWSRSSTPTPWRSAGCCCSAAVPATCSAPPGLHRRAGPCSPPASLLGGLRPGARVAAGLPGRAGDRCRRRIPRDSGPDHRDVPGGPAPQPGPRRVHRDRRDRRRDRAAGRGGDHHLPVLALGDVRQRAVGLFVPALATACCPTSGRGPAVRRGRRDHRDGRGRVAGVRAVQRGDHPERCLALGRRQGGRFAVRRGGAAGGVRGDRDPQQVRAAADAAAAQPGPFRSVRHQLVRRYRDPRHVLLPDRVHPGGVGYSALRTGVAYLPYVPAVLVMTVVAQRGVSRIGARPLLIAGSAIAAGGCSGCPGSASTAPMPAGCSARRWSSGPDWACCSCRCPWSS